MTNLTEAFDAQRRREFLRSFRAAHPEIFDAPAADEPGERAKAIAKLDELAAHYRDTPCAPLTALAPKLKTNPPQEPDQ